MMWPLPLTGAAGGARRCTEVLAGGAFNQHLSPLILMESMAVSR